jgi:hypothetical protein
VSVFSKKELKDKNSAANISINKIRKHKRENQSKWQKRKIPKRYVTNAILLSSELNYFYRNINLYNYCQFCIHTPGTHPNSLRAPPVFYCI